MEIITIEDLSFSYAGENKKALDSVSLSINGGEFVVLCGATGSGKSTLLRMLKPELTPEGEKRGSILIRGRSIDELSARESAQTVGFVMQRPEQQIVTDKVWHELVFGLENIGCERGEMSRRAAEAAQYFGLSELFETSTDELSGGQKQLLSLAAITAMRPDVLILDEPTSRLDPVSATALLEAVGRLNRETGTTVIIAEHRLDELLPLASRLVIMKDGAIEKNGAPREVCRSLSDDPAMLSAMPAAARLYHAAPAGDICPMTVGEGRSWLIGHFQPDNSAPGYRRKTEQTEAALSFEDVYFRYSRTGNDILRSACLDVKRGEVFCILGGNGSGKTTALKAAAGLIKPYSGEIKIFGRKISEYRGGSLYRGCVSMLPQDTQTLFLRMTVKEELSDSGISLSDAPFGLSELSGRHPYDLSGGQQQLLGLAKVLAAKPRLLLLDEPANGLDPQTRRKMSDIIKDLAAGGMTVVIVTHDADFAAETADRCALFFRGSVIVSDEPHRFFSESTFYTTAVSRITRGHIGGCVTVAEAAAKLRKRGGDGA